MSFASRYFETKVVGTDRQNRDVKETSLNAFALVRDVGIAVGLLILFLILNPVNTVQTGTRGVVTRGGKIIGVEQEGWVLLPPWDKLQVFNIRAETVEIANAEAATQDTQPVHENLTIRYNVAPDKVAEVYEQYSHTGDLSSFVETATQEVFKAVSAKYTAPDLIAKRAQVSQEVYAALQTKLDKYGAKVINIDVKNFHFEDQYMKAINQKVEQEQLRLVAENKLLTVESEQKQKVAIAEAEASAVKAKAEGDAAAVKTNADGDAYATLKNAQAEAEALKIKNTAVAGNPQILELQRILVEQTKAEKWNGQLPEAIYASAPIPFLNAPVVGSSK